jgi:hypothetical protein
LSIHVGLIDPIRHQATASDMEVERKDRWHAISWANSEIKR